MAFHNLRDIRFRPYPVPDSLRIDDHARAKVAMIQTAGFVRPYCSFQPQPLHLFFEKGLEVLRSPVRATTARIVLRPLVHTDEDVMLERGHCLNRREITLRRTGNLPGLASG